MNDFTVFDFEGVPVRTTIRDGSLWFFLVDVCRVLEISNPMEAASCLDADERVTLDSIESYDFDMMRDIGGKIPIIINEFGLHNLTMTNRKPAAKRLTLWVGKVLRSIWRNSGYGQADASPRTHDQALRSLLGGCGDDISDFTDLPLGRPLSVQDLDEEEGFEPLDPNKIDWVRVCNLSLFASEYTRIDADGVERPANPQGIIYHMSAVWPDGTSDLVFRTPDRDVAITSAISWSRDRRVPVYFVKSSRW